VTGFIDDLKRSLRMFQQSPGFAVAAIVMLAIGIGANTAVFSIVDTVLLKPLDIPDADRVVQFMLNFQGKSFAGGSPREFVLWQQETNLFQDVSAHRFEVVNITGKSEPEQISSARVTVDFFRLFGAPLLYGRTFTADEDRLGGERVALLSYEWWTRYFGADPRIIGKSISLNGSSYIVIGILGPGFNPEQFAQRPDVWIPFQMDPQNTEACYCHILGRLKPGVTLAMANARLRLVTDEYRRTLPKLVGAQTTVIVEALREAIVGDVQASLIILLGAVSFVLLIACTNVANLFLIRATDRQRDTAIRIALGAGRGRIVLQLLTEPVILAIGGGVLGLALGLAGIRSILAFYPTNPLFASFSAVNIPRIGERGSAIALDWRVLVFTAAVSVLTGLIFGLIPAIPGSRVDLNMVLKEGGGRSGTGFRQNRVRSLLVIIETALALVLLVGAALLLRTSLALRAVSPGFESHKVLIMQMSLAGERYEKTSEVDRVVRAGVDHIHAVPGVAAVASSCCVPLETVWQLTFNIVGRPLEGNPFHGFGGWTFISPEYFDAFKIPVLRGRAFTDHDDAGAPGVVIINQAMAQRFWHNSDPLGEQLIVGRGVRPEYDQDPPRQIVGIVGDIRDVGLNQAPRPAMYVPIAQLPDGINALNLRLLPVAWIIRTDVDPHSLASSIQDSIRESTGLPVARVRAMDEVASQSTARTQLNTLLMTIFGCIALLLAGIGIYGIMAYSVQQRTQEIGIRLALGAQASHVRNMVILQGMYLAAAGIVIGFSSALVLARFLDSFLFGVKPWDAAVLVTVPVLLLTVALFAVWLPARRAIRIDPVDALRYE
jgi:putative ABC transport system permease protein